MHASVRNRIAFSLALATGSLAASDFIACGSAETSTGTLDGGGDALVYYYEQQSGALVGIEARQMGAAGDGGVPTEPVSCVAGQSFDISLTDCSTWLSETLAFDAASPLWGSCEPL